MAALATDFDREEEDEEEEASDDRVLNEEERGLFRGAAARANYLALDRLDIVFAAKELCRRMAVPRVSDFTALRRLACYLAGTPRVVQQYPWQGSESLKLFTDTDFAGCTRTRRSTNGGVCMRGRHLLKHYSRTQKVVTLSSAEAELGGVVQGASEGLGIQSIAADLGMDLHLTLLADSSAAIGICRRSGIGRVRHLAVGQLWVQERIRDGTLGLRKVPGEANPADIGTKHLAADAMRRCLQAAGGAVRGGRSSAAPALASENVPFLQDLPVPRKAGKPGKVLRALFRPAAVASAAAPPELSKRQAPDAVAPLCPPAPVPAFQVASPGTVDGSYTCSRGLLRPLPVCALRPCSVPSHPTSDSQRSAVPVGPMVAMKRPTAEPHKQFGDQHTGVPSPETGAGDWGRSAPLSTGITSSPRGRRGAAAACTTASRALSTVPSARGSASGRRWWTAPPSWRRASAFPTPPRACKSAYQNRFLESFLLRQLNSMSSPPSGGEPPNPLFPLTPRTCLTLQKWVFTGAGPSRPFLKSVFTIAHSDFSVLPSGLFL